MTFAAETEVPVNRTKVHIEELLIKYGAKRFATYTDVGRAEVLFEIADRRVRFALNVPVDTDKKSEQGKRTAWRALYLCIKSKLVSVESKIETFEEAFLSHIVLPSGRTVGDEVKPRIKAAYLSGEMTPLLPHYPSEDS